jgi:serine/threonine protein kinase
MSMIGKTLVHYEITAEIGRGGMGEVYQAKDTKLGRDVAIKVLPEEFALDTDRVARFQREAKLLASLNHPNIAAIYGLEESEGIHFLVMELIEGDTLGDRIQSGPIPVEEVLKLALQMAEALEAAHEKGVIHRDLKPANIKVTPDGKVKILDFGLAKAYVGDQGNVNLADSPTISVAATQQGVILGTAAYMSPEQARGKPVDKRADIWAFGCVLYEMLTGKSAFQGEDVSETLASVIKGDSNLSLLPANIHPRVREVITRCLQKEQKKRYGGIGEAQYEIEQVLADPSGVFVQPSLIAKPKKKLQVGIPLVSAIAILCLIVAGVAGWYMKPIEPHRITRFSHELPEGQEFENLYERVLEVSPDGRQIVYRTNEGLYLRSVDQLDARFLPGTQGAQKPFFSPDGQWIGFLSTTDNQLKKIPISGGSPVKLTGVASFGSCSWGVDDRIVYGEPGIGIMRVSSNGGTPEVIVEERASILHPQILPDEKSVLFTNISDYPGMVMVQSLETGERKELFQGHDAKYLPTGHLVYELDSSIFAVPFDLDRLALTGGPISMIQGVYREGTPQYAVSDSGTLVYVPGTTGVSQQLGTLVWVDRSGKEEAIDAPPRPYVSAHLSPDATRVALDIRDQKNDIWIRDLDRKTLTRLTYDPAIDFGGIWSPDGTKVVYANQMNIYQRPADGSGSPELLTTIRERRGFPETFSPDGKHLLITGGLPSTDISLFSIDAGEAPKPLVASKFNEYNASISPDGRWMAYQSDKSGRFEIYVRPFPEVNALLCQISTEGGECPLWNKNGRELFYFQKPGIMVSVPLETGTSFKAGTPKVLFKGEYRSGFISGYNRTQHSVTPDGQRFLMIKAAGAKAGSAPPRQINVILNWFEELKQRVPVHAQ